MLLNVSKVEEKPMNHISLIAQVPLFFEPVVPVACTLPQISIASVVQKSPRVKGV
jgi:hypothetical protein